MIKYVFYVKIKPVAGSASLLTSQTVLMSLICDGPQSSCLMVISAALMLQGVRLRPWILEMVKVLQKSAWHRLTEGG